MSKFRSWLDNYWYHYKWHTFFGLFAAALVIIAGISLVGKKEYDVYAVYAGPHAFVENEAGDLESDISKYCKTDYTGNGKIETNILSFVYVSPERAKEYLENGIFYSEPINYEARKSIVSQLNSGDSFIYLMDASLFDELCETGYFISLSSIFGKTPECAYNAYGILLKDTAFGQECKSTEVLPEDTVLCIKKNNAIMSVFGTKKNEEKLQKHEAVFKEMVGIDG